MLRDMMIAVAEILFSMTGGEMLINTFWFFPWVVFWAVIMTLPIFYVTYTKRHGTVPSWPGLVFIIGFFPAMLLASGPGIVQMDMMQECETVPVSVSTDRVDTSIAVQQCRKKLNYYGEFGPWQVLDTRGR